MTWKPLDIAIFAKRAPTFADYAPKADDRILLARSRSVGGEGDATGVPVVKRPPVDPVSYVGDSIVRGFVYLLVGALLLRIYALIFVHEYDDRLSLATLLVLALPFAVVTGFRSRGPYDLPFRFRPVHTVADVFFRAIFAPFVLLAPGTRDDHATRWRAPNPFTWKRGVLETVTLASYLLPMYALSIAVGESVPHGWPWVPIATCLGVGFAPAFRSQETRKTAS